MTVAAGSCATHEDILTPGLHLALINTLSGVDPHSENVFGLTVTVTLEGSDDWAVTVTGEILWLQVNESEPLPPPVGEIIIFRGATLHWTTGGLSADTK